MQLACMFPGQGSQFIGMLADFHHQYPVVADTFAQASSVLGKDYWSMTCQGPEAVLNETTNTQVLMLIADTAIYRLLRQEGMPAPQIMVGHSLGEYPALVAAEALDFEDALRLVQRRAELMQGAQGAMAAIIGLDDETVTDICAGLVAQNPIKVLEPANYNAPGQVVIAGDKELIEMSIPRFEAAGARMCKVLAVSVPCHCRLMEAASALFYQALQATPMQLPNVPVLSNVNGQAYQSLEQMQSLLAQQLYQPVRWTKILQNLQQAGINLLLECGPSKVLSGLAKRTVPAIKTLAPQDKSQLPQWEKM